MGSSPHTRGARVDAAPEETVGGIIPAYAGSTKTTSAPAAGRGDHPRIRGEHEPETLATMLYMGSSPHTRGALVSCSLGQWHLGIIPAYAGSTGLLCGQAIYYGDHPRIRGEHR